MIGTQHAVTPTDTRKPGARASEKSEKRLTEITDELWDLATELADEAARSDIECCARMIASGGKEWYDPRYIVGNDADLSRNRELVDRAMRYYELRGDTCTTYQVMRCSAFPSLFRFEKRS